MPMRTPHDSDVIRSGCSRYCIKKGSVLLKEEKTCYEMVYYFVFRLSQSSEIELEMLEFTQTTNGLF